MINEFFKPKNMFFVFLTIEFTFLSGFKIYCKVCKMRICDLKGNYTAVVVQHLQRNTVKNYILNKLGFNKWQEKEGVKNIKLTYAFINSFCEFL